MLTFWFSLVWHTFRGVQDLLTDLWQWGLGGQKSSKIAWHTLWTAPMLQNATTVFDDIFQWFQWYLDSTFLLNSFITKFRIDDSRLTLVISSRVRTDHHYSCKSMYLFTKCEGTQLQPGGADVTIFSDIIEFERKRGMNHSSTNCIALV